MKKFIVIFTTMILVVSGLGMIAVRQYYTRHRPESPQIELGRTVAVQLNYGKTVYVTPAEKRMLVFSNEWFVIPLVIVVIYMASRNRKSKDPT